MKNSVSFNEKHPDTALIDISACLAKHIGDEHGLRETEETQLSDMAKEIHTKYESLRQARKLGFSELIYNDDLVTSIETTASKHRGRWDAIVVLGIGGSALGVTMLFDALCHPHHNILDTRSRKNAPKLFVIDNIDPTLIAGLKEIINPANTLLTLITKSGGTIETWANYFLFKKIFHDALKEEQIIAITDPKTGYLRQTATINRWQALEIPPDVGGRFSVLTPVGLFPASVLGIDIHDIIAGARDMDTRCRSGKIDENPALLLAALHFHFLKNKNKPIAVLMPYSNALLSFADWYRQLWAESLGKRYTLDGKEVFTGQTPVKALGATDQHSQLQLYREGPNDKIITLLKIKDSPWDATFPEIPENSPFAGLQALSCQELLNIELDSVKDALIESSRPVITLQIPEINPYILGELIYLYELATCYMGLFLNINTFDQPGVELGKIKTKERITQLFEARKNKTR